MEEAEIPGSVLSKRDEIKDSYLTNEWLFRKGKKSRSERELKIAGDVQVVQRMHKAQGGLIRALLEMNGGPNRACRFFGRFFLLPSGCR